MSVLNPSYCETHLLCITLVSTASSFSLFCSTRLNVYDETKIDSTSSPASNAMHWCHLQVSFGVEGARPFDRPYCEIKVKAFNKKKKKKTKKKWNPEMKVNSTRSCGNNRIKHRDDITCLKLNTFFANRADLSSPRFLPKPTGILSPTIFQI